MLLKNILSIGSLVVIAGLTLTTSVYGATKAADVLKLGTPSISIPAIRTTEEVEKTRQVAEAKPAVSVAQSQQSQKSAASNVGTTPAPTKVQTTGTSTVVVSPTPNANQCVITLFGKKYDVAPLRTQHSGGNVFVCNTDMTAMYQSQHGTNVSSMAKYSLADGTQTGSGSSTNGSSGSSSGTNTHAEDDDHDEREDNELEEMSEDEDHHSEADKKLSEANREAAKKKLE